VVATSILDPTKSAAATVTVNEKSGCSAAPGSFAGLLPILALLGWLFGRRRSAPLP
jgi:uncharacterized protein (TIGR03382 family)